MTGDNFCQREDFQPAFWPSEWRYEPEREFAGMIDAPDGIPAGALRQFKVPGGYCLPVPMTNAREAQ